MYCLSFPLTSVCVCLCVAAINGYMFGNLPGIELCQGQTVAWHLFGMGNEVDIHSAFFHGNTLLDRGHRTDVLSLFPATFVTAQMVPKATGKWLLACQVNDHLDGRTPLSSVLSFSSLLWGFTRCVELLTRGESIFLWYSSVI